MSTSIIRTLHNRLKSGEAKEVLKDSGIPAAMGLALGYAAGKGHLDAGPVPLEALGGGLVMAASFVAPIPSLHREEVRQTAGNAIAIGFSRLGQKLAHGASATHHGEWDNTKGGFGTDPLVAASSRL
jgi:hypothetical protein